MADRPEQVEVQDELARGEWRKSRDSGMGELISSYNLVHALMAFVDSGLSKRLQDKEGRPLAELLDGLDAEMGEALLKHLSVRGVLESAGESYRLSARGRMLVADMPYAMLGFYSQAYAPVLERMTPLLRGKLRYGQEVHRDGEALGRHCAVHFHYFGTGVALAALEGMGASCVLDLGCGGAWFLIDACRQNPKLRGVGLDISPEAIEFAKKSVAEAGLSDRIQLVVGDAFQPETWPEQCKQAEAIFTVGTLHEQFRGGEAAVIALLDKYAAMMESGGFKGMVLGEPELRVNEKDVDFYLMHAFTRQGMPRPRDAWLELFPKTKLQCRRVLSAPETGPEFAFFDLGVRGKSA